MILYDYGGVIADHYCQPYLRHLALLAGSKESSVLAAMSESTDHGRAYRLGLISQKEFWRLVAKQLGVKEFDDNAAQLLWAKTYIPNSAMLSLATFLRKEFQVITGLVLNEDKPRLDWVLKQSCDISSCFDIIYASCEIGFVKPQPEFYSSIIKDPRWGCSPSEILIIDDRESHVTAPIRLGFKTYKHVSAGESNTYLSGLFYETSNHR